MQINIENLHNTYKISYKDFDVDCYHFITVPEGLGIEGGDLFRLAIYSRPKNSSYYSVVGVSIDERHKTDVENGLLTFQ